MSDSTDPVPVQHSIEMPNGVVMSGAGGDPEIIREQLEDRHEERTGQPVPAAKEPLSSEEAPKSRKRIAQERIDKAVAAEKEAQRRADAAEARLRELESRSAAKPEEPAKRAQAAEPTRPKPTEDEVGTKYQSYADFVEDLADWKVEQREAKQNLKHVIDATVAERIEADRATRSFHDSAAAMVERGRKVFTDFDAVQKSGPGSHVNLGPERTQAILRLPYAEHVIYEACKSAALAQELLSISNPIEFGMRLASLKPTERAADAAPSRPVVPMTNAVPPMQPVGTSSRTSQPALSELASKGHDFDSSGYRERRAAERKAASR